jgi:uncharacterized protein YhbP (UPF0306 family)
MAEEQLNNLIDGIRARLHEELDVQLASMTATHARAVEEARRAGEADAEQRSAALLDTARAESTARLESEVASVRAEANRTIVAETLRARVEAEQAAAESAAAARRELEQDLEVERQRLEAALAAEGRRTSELEADGQRTAADLDAHRQRVSTLEAQRQTMAAELEGERDRIAELEAERQRSAGEIDVHRRRIAELDGEQQRHAEVDAERQRLAGELEAQRRRIAELDGEQQRHAEVDAERQRLTGELEAQRRRIDELEGEAPRHTEVEAARQHLAGELEARTADLEQAHQRHAELDAAHQRLGGEIETQRQQLAELEGARLRSAELETERQRLAGEIDAQRYQIAELEGERLRHAALEAEHQRLAGELETERADERHKVAAQIQSAREHAQAELDAERQHGARALTDAHAAFDEERIRLASPTTSAPAEAEESARFLDAIRALDEAATLSEVLGAAVRGAAAQAPRAAVFVLHGTELREWPVAGVPSVYAAPLKVDGREAGVIAEAMRRSRPVASGGMDAASAPAFALLPSQGVALAVPLLLGGIPVAVLYADERGEGRPPASWQDKVQILGRHAAACAASMTAVRTAQALRLMSGGSSGALVPASDPGQDEIHAARRYARLLVSEIKLYNESAVRLGRERRDLLLRLEPEIERARRLYDERVAPTVNGRDTLFEQELAQTLADGDSSLLGTPGHPRASW